MKFLKLTPDAAERFYTGPRFRRHVVKPADWSKCRRAAMNIRDNFGRAFMLALVDYLEKKFALKSFK